MRAAFATNMLVLGSQRASGLLQRNAVSNDIFLFTCTLIYISTSTSYEFRTKSWSHKANEDCIVVLNVENHVSRHAWLFLASET